MMQKIKKFMILTVGALSILVCQNATLVSAAGTPPNACDNPTSIKNQIECGSNNASGQTGGPKNATKSLNTTITKLINLLSLLVGLIAVIMIVLGGFRYITSGGNEQNVAAAKRTVTYALIGLLIVVLAQVIVRFVLRESTTA